MKKKRENKVEMEKNTKRVAVIGAGPAGLTVAYELLKRSSEFDITIFEKEKVAYGHFPRPSGPRSPARQGHIKRPVLRLAEPSFLRPANQCC